MFRCPVCGLVQGRDSGSARSILATALAGAAFSVVQVRLQQRADAAIADAEATAEAPHHKSQDIDGEGADAYGHTQRGEDGGASVTERDNEASEGSEVSRTPEPARAGCPSPATRCSHHCSHLQAHAGAAAGDEDSST